MNARIPRIALDAMSGDNGPSVTVPAALQILTDHPQVHLLLVGNKPMLKQQTAHLLPDVLKRIEFHHASQIVSMDEPPAMALRSKKDSSMRVAINLVKQGKADACVSAGNTGALMATARYVLKTLGGIDRPAISTAIPTIKGHTHVLDLGGNVDVSPRHLLEFALMGSVLSSAVDNLPAPRVALLNIGEESTKGNECVKEAARLLTSVEQINYTGFIEGDGVYAGEADVVVCDGFVGNVALKTSEGVAKMISHFVKEAFNRNLLTKLAALVAMPVLQSLRKRIDPRSYNGASLLGLRGIVIKSHGGADVFAFRNAIRQAIIEVEKNVPARIHDQLVELLKDDTQEQVG